MCACCTLDATTDDQGNFFVAFRAAGEIEKGSRMRQRDMLLLTSTNRGKTFKAQTIDTWEFNACPASSTAIATAPGREVSLAWETKGQAFFGLPSALQDRVEAPSKETGPHKRVALAVNADGHALFVWREGHPKGRLQWRIFDEDGAVTTAGGQSPGKLDWSRSIRAAARSDGSFVLSF